MTSFDLAAISGDILYGFCRFSLQIISSRFATIENCPFLIVKNY